MIASVLVLTIPARAAMTETSNFLEPYDCKVGYTNWEKGWSTDKKTWCCAEKQLGCIPSHPYDCLLGFENWEEEWSFGQKIWCCEKQGRGCPTKPAPWAPLQASAPTLPPTAAPTTAAPTPPVEPYICEDGLSMADVAWSPDKKNWCCTNKKLGCPTVGCDVPCVFDGLSHTCGERVRWSALNTFVAQENSCALAMDLVLQQCGHCRTCTIEEAGCKPATTLPPLIPPATTQTPAPTTQTPAPTTQVTTTQAARTTIRYALPSAERAAERAREEGPTTTVAATTAKAESFDCDYALAEWETVWSDNKKEWCCREKDVGCPEEKKEQTEAGDDEDVSGSGTSSDDTGAGKDAAEETQADDHGEVSGSGASSDDSGAEEESAEETQEESLEGGTAPEGRDESQENSPSEAAASDDDDKGEPAPESAAKEARQDEGTSGAEAQEEEHLAGAAADEDQEEGEQNHEASLDGGEQASSASAASEEQASSASAASEEHASKVVVHEEDQAQKAVSQGEEEVAEDSAAKDEDEDDEVDCDTSMEEWSERKAAWCCQHESKGCPVREEDGSSKTENSAREPYHCTGEKAGSVHEWSDVQTRWCCTFYTVGCESESEDSEDDEDADEEKSDKKEEKKGPFDGDWIDKRGNAVKVEGKSITWPANGRAADVTQMDDKSLTMAFAGGEYHARLVDSSLIWDVDDVWKRAPGSEEEEAPTEDAGANSSPSPTPAHEGTADNRVGSVLEAIDLDGNGHLNYTEINLLQKAANVDRIAQETYDQLCKEFGEDPKVGLGVETLTSIYARTDSLGGSGSFSSEVKRKFTLGRISLPKRATRTSSLTSVALVLACALGAVAAVTMGYRATAAARSSRTSAYSDEAELALVRAESGALRDAHTVDFATTPTSAIDA